VNRTVGHRARLAVCGTGFGLAVCGADRRSRGKLGDPVMGAFGPAVPSFDRFVNVPAWDPV